MKRSVRGKKSCSMLTWNHPLYWILPSRTCYIKQNGPIIRTSWFFSELQRLLMGYEQHHVEWWGGGQLIWNYSLIYIQLGLKSYFQSRYILLMPVNLPFIASEYQIGASNYSLIWEVSHLTSKEWAETFTFNTEIPSEEGNSYNSSNFHMLICKYQEGEITRDFHLLYFFHVFLLEGIFYENK